jgi:hypothetical protein
MMKKILVTIFLMAFVVGVYAQKPYTNQAIGERVPLYCGSTGSGTADSSRLPVLFRARIVGLSPGSTYKYFARFISLSDTASSTTTGTGTPIIFKKNGTVSLISSPDLAVSGGHDTFSLPMGFGEYTGWFAATYNNDARFTAGKYVYPIIVLQELNGTGVISKIYLRDSMKVLDLKAIAKGDHATGIYGQSFVKSKSVISLYDETAGISTRPVAITYSENEGVNIPNTPSWYTSKVNGVNGAWGTLIPNDFKDGVVRIEARDMFFDSVMYAHVEKDATWGKDSTINQKGGPAAIAIKSDYAPLLKPEIEFIANNTGVTEGNVTVNMVIRRKYGNADTSKISAFFAAGIATEGADFTLKTGFPLAIRPYGDVTDTIKMTIIDDDFYEPVENAAIRLRNPVNAKIGAQTTHSVNITDNDIPLLSFAKKQVKVREDNGILKVKVKIAHGPLSPSTVHVVVKQKTDSTFIPSEFRIGANNRDTTIEFSGNKYNDSIEFNIPIIDDKFSEDRSDTIILALRNPMTPGKMGPDSLLTLIIEDNDAPSIFSFAGSGLTVKENVGSVKIRVNRKLGNNSASDIIVTYDASPKNAQQGVDYTFTTQLVSFLETDPDSAVFIVPIINDKFSEPKEDAVFVIRSSFNAKISKPDTFKVTIIDDDLPEYKINKITTTKAPSFVLDSLNVKTALRGVVYGINLGPVGSTPGLTFTLMDNTGGIQVYHPTGLKNYTVNEGDSIQLSGTISQTNGMAQIVALDTIIKLGTGKLKTPLTGGALSEATESHLLKYSMVKLANPSKWPTTALAPNTSVTVKVLTQSDSFDLLIDSETDIDGRTAPEGFMNITGLGGQNDATSPYNSNYYLAPRRWTDFQTLTVPVFSFTTASTSTVENRDSTTAFTLQCANLTGSQQVSLTIKGGTATRGTDYQSNLTRLFILSPSQPSIQVRTKLNDDQQIEGVTPETIIWAIRDNSWGTLVGPDSIHVANIIDNESVSIEMVKLNANTKLYPNPSPANALVSVTTEAQISSISIIDINGKVISTISDINESATKIETNGLTKGMYIVSIVTDKGTVVKQLNVL